MTRAAVARRPFDPSRDARRFVFLLDEEEGRLLEVVAVRRRVSGDDAVKVLDVARDLPDDPFEALDTAAWIPVEEATALAVVEPMRDHQPQ